MGTEVAKGDWEARGWDWDPASLRATPAPERTGAAAGEGAKGLPAHAGPIGPRCQVGVARPLTGPALGARGAALLRVGIASQPAPPSPLSDA